MRDDLLHHASLDERLAGLMAAAAPSDAAWLRSMLSDPESVKAFAAVDNELYIRGEAGTRAIAVTSAVRGEGRTTISLLLAILTAALDSSKRVLLIDADSERGRIGAMLGLPADAAGLAEVFAGKVQVGEAVHVTALPNLSVVPQGRGEAHVLAFAPRAFEAVLLELRGHFDVVIVDTPAGGVNKSVLSIVKLVGQAVVVVKYMGPTREQVASLMGDLKRAGAEVIGCVMNQRRYVIPPLLYGRS